MEPRYEYVVVGLPLSVTTFATLGDLMNKAWPDATIITDPQKAGVPRDVRAAHSAMGRAQIIRIDTTRAPKRVSKAAARAVVDENARAEDACDEDAVDFLGIEDEWVRMAMPEDLSLLLGSIANRLLEGTEGAVNYVEFVVHDKETGAATVVSCARSKGQTPHALREKAEKENEVLRDLLNEAVSAVETSAISDDFWARYEKAVPSE